MGRIGKLVADGFEFPEGATPISDYSGLKVAWVQNTGDLNRVEAENILKALRKYLQKPVDDPKNWFDAKELKKIHHTMFGDVWEWAGAYRKETTSIGIKPGLIPSQLGEFCVEVQSWLQYSVELTLVEMAARIHHRLVYIHPFENGNGRFSRLIADYFLFAWGCPYPTWPNQLYRESPVRKEYIQTLRKADRGDYTSLIDFMKRLGARDPTIIELLMNKFYQTRIRDDRLSAMVRALLRGGASPNEETLKGHRPLQVAVRQGLEEVVRLLMDAGAAIDVRDRSGLTPFQVAVLQENKVLADLFLSRGAKREAPPDLGYAK
jgi:Fic-DOC domain mobile mystery protein B